MSYTYIIKIEQKHCIYILEQKAVLSDYYFNRRLEMILRLMMLIVVATLMSCSSNEAGRTVKERGDLYYQDRPSRY